MNVVDLHPEDLLDKQSSGELTDSERALLESHLERCDTCRFELQLRDDFAAEMAEDHHEEGRRSKAPPAPIVAPIVAKEDAPAEKEDVVAPPPVLSSRPPKKRRMVWLLVAAALCVGGVAGAAGAVPVWRSFTSPSLDATYMPTDRAPSAAAPAPSPALTESAIPRLEPTAVERDLDPVTKGPPPAAVITPVAFVPPSGAAVPSVAHAADAAALFDDENDARRRGDYTKVVALHDQLQRRFPTSHEAHVSHATLGRLRLDRGDAAGALASFDAYRAGGGGELDESVMVGRARALEHLGRGDEEKLAWQSLLAAFPSTPWAEHARERLAPR